MDSTLQWWVAPHPPRLARGLQVFAELRCAPLRVVRPCLVPVPGCA
ncbi:hypothetical protein [Cyanobium sp. Morenito 9A2]|nr:hypothetical protein [Cyanobium sp. Morenito 9A2]